jgi:SnoaL-like domain
MTYVTARAARTILIAVGLSAVGVAGQAAPAAKGPMAPIRQFIDDFNKGDSAGAKAAHVASPSIIDEVPPHAWNGPGAFDAWSGDLAKDATAHGDTGGKVTLGSTIKSQVDGDTAYVVIHATYAYDEKGQAMAEPASFTFALRHAAGGWKIASWAWNGTTPHAVKAKASAPAAAAAKPAAGPAAKPGAKP